MTDTELFDMAAAKAKTAFKKFVPNPKTRGIGYYKNAYGNWQKRSTGKMSNSTRLELVTGVQATIKCKTEYIVYTNEPWISPKWKGHKNPNEGWFERATLVVAHSLANSFDGKVVRIK